MYKKNTDTNASILINKFISNQNKGIIWTLLIENGFFRDIPDTKSGLIKSEFDNKINFIGQQITPNDQIINLNKRVITEMIELINKHRTDPQTPPPIYKATELTEQRQSLFQKELQSKQNEFEKLINNPVPEKVEFADKLDTPIGAEMDKMLAEKIAWREQQLNMVLETQDKNAATKWLKNEGTAEASSASLASASLASASTSTSTSNSTIQLKIGETINLKKNEVIIKKVNFADVISDANSDHDFMKFLKPIAATNAISTLQTPNKEEYNDSELSVKEMLREILNNQTKILALLQKSNI
jgi:hypothetical protein